MTWWCKWWCSIHIAIRSNTCWWDNSNPDFPRTFSKSIHIAGDNCCGCGCGCGGCCCLEDVPRYRNCCKSLWCADLMDGTVRRVGVDAVVVIVILVIEIVLDVTGRNATMTSFRTTTQNNTSNQRRINHDESTMTTTIMLLLPPSDSSWWTTGPYQNYVSSCESWDLSERPSLTC